ncbi:uncharacterized protein LOC128043036 [Gossypium raimondii]|uniref:uncharacterized protein LOC128043036 n=1 Tax=Gossypium raimondii TaxID=29730 RepID=UPI00227A35A7|nr:uncharacterized protein LOC128043036 [Gossypium raimondii]
MVKQDFERKNADLEKRIEQMEAEKMNLRLDIDVQKLENERLKKEKNKVDEEIGSLKTDYKKLRLSIRTAGLGKTSEQWRVEIQEEKGKANRWEQKFQEMQRRNEALEKSLLESQKEKGELKDRVIVLERSLRQYRSRNSTIELKASLSKIEEMEKRIEELETELQNCEIQIKHLKVNESHSNEQLHHFQNQVRSRDHLIKKAVVQIREVADHIQTLAVQADTLSVKYESESKRGQELALLLRKIRVLVDKGKGLVLNNEEGDNEGPVYSSGLTSQQAGIYPRKSSVTIKPYDENAIRSGKIEAGEGSRRSSSKRKENEKLVERLISMGVVKLDDSPNTENPLPDHNGVNMIGGIMGRKIKEDISEVKIPLRWI